MPKYYVLHPYSVPCMCFQWTPSGCALPWVGPSLTLHVLLSYLKFFA